MSKTIPKNPVLLQQEIINMVTKFCNTKHPAVTIVFCKELGESSRRKKELEWFCNHQCKIHQSPFELICLDYSILETLKGLAK